LAFLQPPHRTARVGRTRLRVGTGSPVASALASAPVTSRTPRTPPPLPCLHAGTRGWTPHQQHRAAAASGPSAAGVTAPVALTLGRGVTYKFLGRRRPLRSRPLGFSSPFLCCYLSSSAKRGKAEKGKGEGRRAPPCREATGSPPPSPRLHPRRARAGAPEALSPTMLRRADAKDKESRRPWSAC
jgi:hypothetical protein